jgi:hypothetical protein
VGWALLVTFAAMVAIWTGLGFAPWLVGRVPWPVSEYGRVDAFWPIVAGFIAGGGAAWALAPSRRIARGASPGDGLVGLSPIAAAILGPAALLMIFASYWPCTGEENEFWSAMRHAMDAFEGYVAEPFGVVAGCPASFPQTLTAGVLFGRTTIALVILLAVAYVFRRSIDIVRAQMARQVVIFAGLSDETVPLARQLARSLTERQTLLLLEDGAESARAEELAREFARDHCKAIAMTIDITDDEAIERLMRRRRAKGIHGVYLLLPDAAENLNAMETFLRLHEAAVTRRRGAPVDPSAPELLERAKLNRDALLRSPDAIDRRIAQRLPRDPHATHWVSPLWWRRFVSKLRPLPSEVPGRAVVRIDNPWQAEDWRRRQMLARTGWLFDAVSTHSTAARHVVHRMKFPMGLEEPVRRVVIQGTSSFELAIMAELAFERAVDGVLDEAAAAGERDANLVIADERSPVGEVAAARANLASIAYWRKHIPPTPEVVLSGSLANEIDEHVAELLTRYGVQSQARGLVHIEQRSLAEEMEGGETALVVSESATMDPTLLAVPHPRWPVIAWSDQARGINQRPLIGGLTLVGPTLEPVAPAIESAQDSDVPRIDDAAAAYGLDVWERLGRIEHKCYLLRNWGGLARKDAVKPARGDWDVDLTATLREGNIRPFATLVRTITELGYSWASDLGDDGSQARIDLQARDDDWKRAGINEHASWVVHRLEDGWAFAGPDIRDDRRRLHPNIVDWDHLTTKLQGHDFEGVGSALRLFAALGFVLAPGSR